MDYHEKGLCSGWSHLRGRLPSWEEGGGRLTLKSLEMTKRPEQTEG